MAMTFSKKVAKIFKKERDIVFGILGSSSDPVSDLEKLFEGGVGTQDEWEETLTENYVEAGVAFGKGVLRTYFRRATSDSGKGTSGVIRRTCDIELSSGVRMSIITSDP